MQKPKREDFASWYEYHNAREKWEKRKTTQLFLLICGGNALMFLFLVSLLLLNR